MCGLQQTVQSGTPPTGEAPGENSVGDGKLPWNVAAGKRHVKVKEKGRGRNRVLVMKQLYRTLISLPTLPCPSANIQSRVRAPMRERYFLVLGGFGAQ